MIEAVMQSAAKGKVEKRPGSCLKFKLFDKVISQSVLQTYKGTGKGGSLCLIAGECCITIGSSSQHSGQRNSSEFGSGLLSRWLPSHYHGGVHD
ncbi:ADP-ribosylation factor GTPase-activating protein AGD3 [Spatholobus suberectus]|nr:ADP-ribosylation factor GTPase-activating protein AGD3 [Spatholobus suberectus]